MHLASLSAGRSDLDIGDDGFMYSIEDNKKVSNDGAVAIHKGAWSIHSSAYHSPRILPVEESELWRVQHA